MKTILIADWRETSFPMTVNQARQRPANRRRMNCESRKLFTLHSAPWRAHQSCWTVRVGKSPLLQEQ
jgi:hypothetical protein